MKFDLEERLIDYAVINLEVVEMMPDNRGANHLAGQLVRCETAPALMYGEAQGAESRRDFIHKMKVALKELRESFICQRVIHKRNYLKGDRKLKILLKESDELISIFVKSIETAQNNLKKGNQK